MLTLRELQRDFRRALLGGDDTALAPLIGGDTSAARERISIHRNNVFVSLTRVLKDVFPVVCRLVHDRFFAYAAHEFIRAHPPTRAALAQYGAEFPSFLADFEPCQELLYLPDVARLEWIISLAAHASDATPLLPTALADVPPERAPRLVLRLHDSVSLISSPWPIDAIWPANRAGSDEDGSIDLASGSVCLEVRRHRDEVKFQALDTAVYIFRRFLRQALPLESATDAAVLVVGDFNLTTALQSLFSEQLVVGLDFAPQ
jgi:hypothetical protein